MIWFDLDNSPHVPLFRPIFNELTKHGEEYFVTARDFAQTKELLEYWGLKFTLVGKHGGKHKIMKIMNLFHRAWMLERLVKNKRPLLAVSHGSRTQLVAAKYLSIPGLLMLDYEYTESRIFNTLATYLLMPSYISDSRLQETGFNLKKIIRFNGFKEQIYLKDFVPALNFRHELGIDEGAVLVTIRPPSTTGNYHDPKSEILFSSCLDYFSSFSNTTLLIVNRTQHELDIIPPNLHHRGNIRVLARPTDGLQLIWASDIVVSGGGTMNRESALLGVPTFSIFTGRKPYLDEYLEQSDKLRFIRNIGEVKTIPVIKRNRPPHYIPENIDLAETITNIILELGRKNQKDSIS